jgi:hypothetical protein
VNDSVARFRLQRHQRDVLCRNFYTVLAEFQRRSSANTKSPRRPADCSRAGVPDRRDHSRRDAVRRRVLALVMSSPHREVPLASVSATLLVPTRACLRILRAFEAIGLVEGTREGFRVRRRTSSAISTR